MCKFDKLIIEDMKTCNKCEGLPELKFRSVNDPTKVYNLEQIKKMPSQLWQPINEQGKNVGQPLKLDDII